MERVELRTVFSKNQAFPGYRHVDARCAKFRRGHRFFFNVFAKKLSLTTKDLSNILVEFGILWDKIGIINDGKD